MDEEAGQFYVDPEEDEVREIIQIEEPNPIYSKPLVEQPNNISLKMVEIVRQVQPTYYKPFKIAASKTQSQQEEIVQSFTCNSPFTQFYSKQQLVYKKYNNQQFNRYKQSVYFPGSFVPKNLFNDYLRQDSNSLNDIIKEFYQNDEEAVGIQLAPNDLIFDSNFQSGNLFAAFKISDRQYDLVMQNDNNSCGNNQWFYFSVQKLIPGAQFTFNVVNFTKNDSLFNYGMCPVAYSTILNKKSKTQWFRAGKDVIYKKGSIPRQNSRRFYYKLTFKITWRVANDKVYFAYTFPYTYSKLNHKLEGILNKNSDIVTKVHIGKTLSKKNIDALIITQKSKSKKDTRKAIIIMARQHPGQTQGSFVCDGVIDRLIQKGCKQSQFLRRNFIIYIIPMVNPDGVVFGHYRTNLAGKDLNRKWDSSQKQLSCPEIIAIKSFIQEISKEREIRFVLDLHGHSKKLNSFFYGNPMPENPQIVRIYPYLCSKMSPAVQFIDCTFATQEYKKKAARIYLSYIYKQIHVYTYEVSFYAYFKNGNKQQFNPNQFQQLGHNLINCLYYMLENQIKIETKTNIKDSKESFFIKCLNQLKNNKNLLDIGTGNESGSDSKPQQGQVNEKQMGQMAITSKKSVVPLTQEVQKTSKKVNSRKGNRQSRQIRQMTKPVRNIKFLEISRVNSVLPDRYQLGLQPIRKKQSTDTQPNRNQSGIMRINSHCQTDSHEVCYEKFNMEDIEDCVNLSNSMRMDQNISVEKRYSSLIKNTRNNNNIIFKIDFVNNERSASIVAHKQKKVFLNAYSQTIISINKQKNDRIKSSQLFPIVDSPQTQRRTRKNPIKYQTMKIGLKRETEIFLNGMVKKFLLQRQRTERLAQPNGAQRPLSIKRKQIYRK